MLTVKHIDGDGVETIIEGAAVSFQHGVAGDELSVFDTTDKRNPAIAVISDNGCRSSCGPIGGPVVYVMNRFGATIATYKLISNFESAGEAAMAHQTYRSQLAGN